MSCSAANIRICQNRGSDIDFTVAFTDADGNVFELHGYSVTAYDVSAELTSLLSVAISDAAGGIVTGRIEWAETLSVWTPYAFRVRVHLGAEDQASNLFEVIYK